METLLIELLKEFTNIVLVKVLTSIFKIARQLLRQGDAPRKERKIPSFDGFPPTAQTARAPRLTSMNVAAEFAKVLHQPVPAECMGRIA